MNPDRKQLFIEAFSDALASCLSTCDRSQVSICESDIPFHVEAKLKRIEKVPDAFDVTSGPMKLTCAKLGIPQRREAVLAYLAGETTQSPDEIPAELEAALEKLGDLPDLDSINRRLASLRLEFPGWQLKMTEDGVDVSKAA